MKKTLKIFLKKVIYKNILFCSDNTGIILNEEENFSIY